eukprot:CAMPEP_0170337440 /NCGR_PEP_ID=MMETSP0116_2-20130129/69766_1 /TAXON_ID=400756 /ORGANISM="Durinskia baltica, Strain CSIRO CS-38" /LENGTH=57 /DNA_ID=CAMNT_0010590835 /DNA_START=6 /DNA_END=179 /DNA_ORIENTATION=+
MTWALKGGSCHVSRGAREPALDFLAASGRHIGKRASPLLAAGVVVESDGDSLATLVF